MSEESPVCIVCEKVAVEYTRRKWDSPVCYGCLGPGEGPQRRRTDPDFDDRAEPGACCRAAVEALEQIAEHAGSHTIKADDPARSYYGWGYVYDLASAALSAVSGAK